MLLILTCTVNVNSSFTKLVNKEERIQQYIDSFKYYINHSYFTDIIICENSLFDFSAYGLTELAKKNNKRIEILTCKGSYDLIKQKGKGFGEGQIMKYVFENSLLVHEHSGFFKITGRLFIKNINTLIKTTTVETNHFQRSRKKILCKAPALDTKIYYTTSEFFKRYLISAFEHVDDNNGNYLEYCYYDVVRKNKLSVLPFKHYPMYSGLSGTSNSPYDIPFYKYFIYFIVNLIDYSILKSKTI